MDSVPPAKTLATVLDGAGAFLAKYGVDSPRATAEFLAARLLRCKRGELPARAATALPEPILEAMRRGMRRVASGEPLQYVTGQWDFRTVTLKTDRRALVPRPETEELVSLALAHPALRAAAAPLVLDYGTGSGCIALAVAKELPAARVVAVDVSADALALARENAEALGLASRVAFVDTSERDLGDLLEPGSVDAIVSNPPYIPSAAVDRLDPKVLAHEPRLALDGGPDGMAVLRQVAEEASMLLASGGGLFLELDAESGQARPMAAYLRELGFDPVRAHRDLAGAERFLSATLSDGL